MSRTATVTGPFWEAAIDILELGNPAKHAALRTIFDERSAGGARQPNTLLLLGSAKSLSLTLPAREPFTWSRQGAPPDAASYAAIKSALADGSLVLLAVAADATTGAAPDRFRCIGGEIPLDPPRAPDALRASSGHVARLRKAMALPEAEFGTRRKAITMRDADFDILREVLGIRDPGPEPLGDAIARLGAADIDALRQIPPLAGFDLDAAIAALSLEPKERAANLLAKISAHGSGLSIFGSSHLPWQAEGDAALGVFMLTQRDDRFRLAVDPEKLTGEERESIAGELGKLFAAINPSGEGAPSWVSLEAAGALASASIFWEFDANFRSPTLKFGSGEGSLLNLLITDQPLRRDSVRPKFLARLSLDSVAITGGDGGELTVAIAAGDPPEPGRPALSYSFGEGGAESFVASDLEVAFDSLQTPEFLRQHQGIPQPEATDPVTPAEPPMLWASLPLADGWAQIPVPNLTEQIYLNAELEGDINTGSGEADALLKGVVSFGSDDPPPCAPRAATSRGA
ncbi:MAG: hypothetical protein R3F11_09830 [Verrucomicrobiales bacterium]